MSCISVWPCEHVGLDVSGSTTEILDVFANVHMLCFSCVVVCPFDTVASTPAMNESMRGVQISVILSLLPGYVAQPCCREREGETFLC